MTRNLRNIFFASVSVIGLAACGGGGNDGQQPPAPPPSAMTPPPPPPAGTTSVASQISSAFGTTFAADRNSEPRNPSPGDLTVNRTADPINF